MDGIRVTGSIVICNVVGITGHVGVWIRVTGRVVVDGEGRRV